MQIEVFKSKIHRAVVTEADLNYIGSITIDENLMDAANIIENEKVQFQNLVSDKESFSHYPTTEDVYAIVSRLRNYIRQAGAKELFSPMLNIKKTDSTNYTAQVGLPVDKALPGKDDITSKWMMKGGNILSAEVTGGQKQIEEAQKQMELYIMDYQRAIIAIPFQMLITDRTKETDSTKWITRLYYPVV